MRTRSHSTAGSNATDDSDAATTESMLSAKLLKYSNNRWAPVQLSDCLFVKRQEKWWLNASAEAKVEVSGHFNFEDQEQRVTFIGDSVAGSVGGIWRLDFPKARDFQNFCQKYQEKLFENVAGRPYSPTAYEEVFGNSPVNMLSSEDKRSQDQWMSESPSSKSSKKSSAEALAEKQSPQSKKSSDQKAANHGMRLGGRDYSYLIQDDQINVLRNTHGGVEDTNQSILVRPSSSEPFTPKKMLLMGAESKMMLLQPNGQKLCYASLETGKVISEWEATSFSKNGVDISMRDMINSSKGAQLETDTTFFGVDKNRIERWDIRVPTGQVDSQSLVAEWNGGKEYASRSSPAFTCIATSGDGCVATGSEDGVVRLLHPGQGANATFTAKTRIPGLASPITAIDVTYDGQWVLATANAYLIIIRATFMGEDGQEINAFEKQAAKDLPKARLLRLKHEDTDKTMGRPLQHGKFTWITEGGKQERWIVASCGAFTVLWNFTKVREAKPQQTAFGGLTCVTDYELILKDKKQQVVDSVCIPERHSYNTRNATDSMVIVTEQRFWSN